METYLVTSDRLIWGRGAITDFATFDGLGTGNTFGLSPMVKQLLAIDRPQVA